MDTKDERPPLRAQLAALAHREAIRQVLHDDRRAADRGDAARMKACCHPDATDGHGCFVGGPAFADDLLPRPPIHGLGGLVQSRGARRVVQ